MTLIEQNYQKLAQAVIIRAYKDNAKPWLYNEWNFNLFCDLAKVVPNEIKKKFLRLEEKRVNTNKSKTQIARDLGVSYATLDYWHRKYNDLDEAIKYIKSGKHKYQTHSLCDEYYEQIITMRKENKSWKTIAEKLNIEYNTLYGFAQKKNIK